MSRGVVLSVVDVCVGIWILESDELRFDANAPGFTARCVSKHTEIAFRHCWHRRLCEGNKREWLIGSQSCVRLDTPHRADSAHSLKSLANGGLRVFGAKSGGGPNALVFGEDGQVPTCSDVGECSERGWRLPTQQGSC